MSDSEQKCCTKPECDSSKKCKSIITDAQMYGYFSFFGLIYSVVRWSLTTEKDCHHGIWVVLWVQVQVLIIYTLYYITLKSFDGVRACIDNILYFFMELISPRVTDPIMEWMGLIKTDYWGYKGYCIFYILVNAFSLFVILSTYLFLLIFYGGYGLGYYSTHNTDTTKYVKWI